MGLSLQDFKEFAVYPTLHLLAPHAPYTEDSLDLVVETVFHESDGLRYLAQVGGGPGRGLGQCEPPTFEWLIKGVLPKRPALWAKFGAISPNWPSIGFDELTWNLRLAVALVRVRYLPDPQAIPGTLEERAKYWGRVYQTTNDPVKIQAYIDHARRMK
jgi:hypothetical protein